MTNAEVTVEDALRALFSTYVEKRNEAFYDRRQTDYNYFNARIGGILDALKALELKIEGVNV